MLSIVPFEHRLSAKDPERPFKTYHRPAAVALPASPYYSPYQQSYMASGGYDRRGTETMDLRPPPAHIYQQGAHHMLDHMSAHHHHHPMTARDVKLEQENMYGMAHLHQGYGGQELRPDLHHPGHSPNIAAMHGAGLMPRSASSMSPVASSGTAAAVPTTTTGTSPDSHDQTGQTSDSTSDSSAGSQKHILPKKRSHCVPSEMKDSSYWDKRKKNNESAKRSREARRMKEEQIAMRVVYLEQENLQLRTEVSLLKTEIEKLRCMLYNS